MFVRSCLIVLVSFAVAGCGDKKGKDEGSSSEAKPTSTDNKPAKPAAPKASPTELNAGYCDRIASKEEQKAWGDLSYRGRKSPSLAPKMAQCSYDPPKDQKSSSLVLVQIDCRNPSRYMNTSRQLASRKPGYKEKVDIGDDALMHGDDSGQTYVFMAGPCGTSVMMNGVSAETANTYVRKLAGLLADEANRPN